MKNISEGIIDFNTLEVTIFKLMCRVGCQELKNYLQTCDRIIMARRDTKEYRCIDARATTIKTVMGEVTYKRHYYKKQSGGYAFLLDEALGIKSGHGQVSGNLAEQIVCECADKSFRKAAASISSLTGQVISGMGAWGVFRQHGERLEKQVSRLKELDLEGVVGQLGNLPCQVLFSELDDVWLSMQKAKRRKKGVTPAVTTDKAGKKPMHIGTAYTGWEQEKDGRYSTVEKIAYAGFETTSEFTSTFVTLLRQRFDMDGIEKHVMSGDGASWIKAAAYKNDATLQLDPFHRSRAIKRAVNNKTDQQALHEAIKNKDVRGLLSRIADLITEARDESSRKALGELFSYFHNNKSNLLTWQEKNMKLPTPPEGLHYRNLGVQESSNCSLVTHRMKHRKGSWTVKGANVMAKILCFRNTIGLNELLGIFPEPTGVREAIEPLSASKAPLYDGEGYAGKHATMPFEQTFRTSGREAIRSMLRQRPLSDLSFI